MTAKKRAKKVILELFCLYGHEVDWEEDYIERPVLDVLDVVIEAIKGEREECAKMVEKMGQHEFEWAAVKIRRRR